MPKRRRCCASRDRVCASALVGLSLAAIACDGRFAFETETPLDPGGGGSGGAQTASGGLLGNAGTAGSSAGSAGAQSCQARCQALGLTCPESEQACVECAVHGDCVARGAKHCGSSYPVENRCVDCLSNADCAAGEQCNTGTFTCATECTYLDDPLCTALGLRCSPDYFLCGECFDSGDCAGDLRCSDGDQRCVQCLDREDCDDEPGEWCDPVLLSCVACRDSEDCTAGETCDPTTHICYSSFLLDAATR